VILQILQIIAGIATIATGVVSLFWPRSIRGFTGLAPDGGRGITEIRAVLGAFFVGLGASVLILNDPAAYMMLGITYLTVAVVRLVSMFLDKSVERSNIISFVVEVVFGVILVL
jgi:hypothetical protein